MNPKEKRKVKTHEACNKWREYEYADIIDYEHCRFCYYYTENDDFRCPAHGIAERLENIEPCSCGGTEILFVKHTPWFFNTYYIKCPKCEAKTRRSWLRGLAFKRWRNMR